MSIERPSPSKRRSFFFNDTAPTEIYTLSLHDALPISQREQQERQGREHPQGSDAYRHPEPAAQRRLHAPQPQQRGELERQRRGVEQHVGREQPAERQQRETRIHDGRSEEHTSELQSPCNLVCRLLLEKKKKK